MTIIFFEKTKKTKKNKKKHEIDSSCPENRCSNGEQCSTRLNGNYYCQCFGSQCEIGSFLFFFFSFFFCYFTNK